MDHKIKIKSIQGETEELLAFALNMTRRSPQGLKLHYLRDIETKVKPILQRLDQYYQTSKNGEDRSWEADNRLLISSLNPKGSLFLTGMLPTVADFELAYLVDHFKWICDR
jgi:hypothetical protein